MSVKSKIFKTLFLLMAGGLIFNSCVDDEFDEPPVNSLPFVDSLVLTIEEVKQIYADSGEYEFKKPYSVYATVIMDDKNGNIYKSAFVQDSSGGIDLFMDASGGLYVGDYVRLMLEGTTVSEYNELIQIQDFNVDMNSVKLATNEPLEPKNVTLGEILSGGYQSELIRLDSVQFIAGDTSKTYADAANLATENRTLENCDEETIIVRTSGYASFADDPVPNGKGSLVAIVSQYNDDWQLLIRNTDEVNLTGERCEGGGGGGVDPVVSINEDFESQSAFQDIVIEGWTNVAVVGSRVWQGKDFDDNVYAQATAYQSSDQENICWLITPPIDFAESGNEVLSFRSAMAYWYHDGLTVWISTDFAGNVEAATWEQLEMPLAGEGDGNYDWVESGNVNLSSYNEIGYIGFRYEGSAPNGETTSYIIDDVVVAGN